MANRTYITNYWVDGSRWTLAAVDHCGIGRQGTGCAVVTSSALGSRRSEVGS
ncbi:hypothetical protein DPMN_185084 [Dreissena polymorpha]|uniref:Uncharacterized protein n=1 Tax=Dreissena polymorpha TaxID=45954 RepID=A0A9D4DJ15_DREPO|nr:hypothetical protein DPMN_185084 [Dreissena polymorpha]